MDNSELSSRFLQVLDRLEGYVNKTEDFASEQVPLVIQEYVSYTFWLNFTYSAATVVVFVVTVATMIWFLRKSVITPDLRSSERLDTQVTTSLVGGSIAIASIVAFIAFAPVAFKASVAPRVLVLEKISELAR